jgi:hypothetical protein
MPRLPLEDVPHPAPGVFALSLPVLDTYERAGVDIVDPDGDDEAGALHIIGVRG